MQRIGKAAAFAGIDPRYWVSGGTVGVFNDQGEFITADTDEKIAPDAVACEKDGVLVDVRLEPIGRFVSARYHGVHAGLAGSILVPIKAGDEVLVLIPDGRLNSPGISIVTILSNAIATIPTDWKNDRVLIDSPAYPVHIRSNSIRLDASSVLIKGRPVRNSQEPI